MEQWHCGWNSEEQEPAAGPSHLAACPIPWPLDEAASLLIAVFNLSWMCLCTFSRVSLHHSMSFMASLGCAGCV